MKAIWSLLSTLESTISPLQVKRTVLLENEGKRRDIIELHNSHREEKGRSVRTRGIYLPSETKKNRARSIPCWKLFKEWRRKRCLLRGERNESMRPGLPAGDVVVQQEKRRRRERDVGRGWKTNHLMCPIFILQQGEGFFKLKLWICIRKIKLIAKCGVKFV